VPGFTHKNLREDIRDASEGSNVAGSVEARLGRSSLDSEHLGISFFRYAPGFRTPFGHYHREQEEAYVVVGGSGRMKLDGDIIELRQWDVVRVAPEVIRAIEGGDEGLELIAIGGPRPAEGDGESEPNWWPAE
jgi:mannose-6-phosphate isomerase-like protein (cupin superfamily)